MTKPRDPDALLAAFLADGMEVLPDRVVDAVLDEIHRTRQRAVFGPWRTRSISRTAVGAAAAVAVLIVGSALYLNRPAQPAVVGGPSQTPGASASPTAGPSSSVVPFRAPAWTAIGSMGTPRYGHTATLLPSGKVLVAGGYSGSDPVASAELYDPASGTWTATGSMAFARGGHTATLLHTGKVLVAGCAVGPGGAGLGSAELYDPASGTWTDTGDMVGPRCLDFTATLLPDGRVLVVGGRVLVAGSRANPIVATAELYDPMTGTWTATGSMGTPRYDHAAALLPDGKVLVAGGADHPGAGCCYLATAELYDPGTGSWTPTARMVMPNGHNAAVLLADGRVLVGGYTQVYDTVTGSWTVGNQGAGGQPMVLLPDGRLFAFGNGSVELYDAGTGSWAAAVGKGTPRYRDEFTATLLLDGRVLVAGGFSDNSNGAGSVLASAELYDPGSGQ